jgi:transcriptional regulator with XRE-family HTH domain
VITKQRAADVGSERARSIVFELGRELRQARTDHGLSQSAVARAAGISASQVSRVERAQARCLSIRQAARLLSVVGLELSARAYPGGRPIRDVAHRALLDRLRARVPPGVRWRFEVPVGGPGDGRAWDAVLRFGDGSVAVEAETRPRDVQALQRRLTTKLRDDPEVSAVILLLSATRHNRALVKEHGDALRAALPGSADAILRTIAAGRHPGGSGIVLL